MAQGINGSADHPDPDSSFDHSIDHQPAAKSINLIRVLGIIILF